MRARFIGLCFIGHKILFIAVQSPPIPFCNPILYGMYFMLWISFNLFLQIFPKLKQSPPEFPILYLLIFCNWRICMLKFYWLMGYCPPDLIQIFLLSSQIQLAWARHARPWRALHQLFINICNNNSCCLNYCSSQLQPSTVWWKKCFHVKRKLPCQEQVFTSCLHVNVCQL